MQPDPRNSSDRVADRFWSLVLMAAQGTTVWLEGCAPNSEPKMLGRDMPVAAGSISIGRRLLHSCRSNPSAHHAVYSYLWMQRFLTCGERFSPSWRLSTAGSPAPCW